MHLPAETANAEVGEAKASAVSQLCRVPGCDHCHFRISFRLRYCRHQRSPFILRRQFALSNLQTEIVASSLLLGCLLGAGGASMIGDRYGRRKSLIASASLFAFSSVCRVEGRQGFW